MYYAGCDVSLKETFISIVDKDGEIVTEQSVASDVHALSTYLKQTKLPFEKVGIESGQLSIHLCKGLIQLDLPATCVDARHIAAALSARINKNGARGIAQMLRVGLYKEVSVKSDEAREVKFLLGSRNHFLNTAREHKGTLRGLLKMYGIKISSESRFFEDIEAAKKGLPDPIQKAIEATLTSLRGIERSYKKKPP